MIGDTQPLAPVLAPVVRLRRAQWLRAASGTDHGSPGPAAPSWPAA
jgi:hypothetical protein